mmetsp:Transcript_98965/g.279602  ORF Transcript_98965/g.279602 Transcript_98965/m.279602 type:complete len:216 (-) Transcript_98965:655-1302(-)
MSTLVSSPAGGTLLCASAAGLSVAESHAGGAPSCSSSAGLSAGATAIGLAPDTTGPPQTMPQGPQHPVTHTHVGERFASASRKRRRTSRSLGTTPAAVARTSDAGPGLSSRRRAAPFRNSALAALPSITRAASAHRTACSHSCCFKCTAARFCTTAKRRSSASLVTALSSRFAKRLRSPPASPTQMALSLPRSLRKYSSKSGKELITTPKKFLAS